MMTPSFFQTKHTQSIPYIQLQIANLAWMRYTFLNTIIQSQLGNNVSCGVIRDIMILFLYDTRGKRSELRSRLHDKVFDFGTRGTLNRPGGFL